MLQEVRQLSRFVISRSVYLAIENKGYLGVPVRDMLITLPIPLLTQRGNNISESTQALVDILRLFQPILVIPSSALLEPFRTSEIDKVE